MITKKFHSSSLFDRALLGAAILTVLAYAWITARALETKFEAPSEVASEVKWIVGEKVQSWKDIQAFKRFSSEQIQNSLNSFARVLPLIGDFDYPPQLIIDADHKSLYTVGEEKIVLAEEIAVSEGQLEKALIKTWLIQKGRGSFSSSLLRLEVVSDMLAAFLRDKPRFLVPNGDLVKISKSDSAPKTSSNHIAVGYFGNKKTNAMAAANTAVIPEIGNDFSWLHFTKSYESNCQSVWRSLELQGHCGESKKVSSLAYRPLLDAVIWRLYLAQSPFRRYGFLRDWIKLIEAKPEAHQFGANSKSNAKLNSNRSIDLPDSISEKQSWLVGELESLLPFDKSSEYFHQLQTIINQVGLRKPILVSLSFHSPDFLKIENFKASLEGRIVNPVTVSLGRNNHWLVTGQSNGLSESWIPLGKSDLSLVTSPLLIWHSCIASQIGSLMQFPVRSEKVLYIQSCEPGEKMAWSTLITEGVSGFANTHPDQPFVVLQMEMMKFAERKGQIDLHDPLSELMSLEIKSKRSLLGLETAQWSRAMKAYRVIGSIEAIEWVRTPKSNWRL